MPLSSVSITPNNPSVAVNETITFTAIPEGGTPTSYQWNVDGLNVSGANQATYDFVSKVIGTHTIKCYAINGSNPVSETETIKVFSLGDMIRAILEAMD